MELSKEFLYNRDKFILLICDFYETTQIPSSIFEIKDNLALFPIVNMPLIEYILNNLHDQHFKNIIISGKRLDSIITYLKKTKFFEILNIQILKCSGNSLGDIFRSIDDNGFEFKDLIVMYANHYTNIPLNRLLKKHRRSKDTFMTIFTHKSQSNDPSIHLYGIKDNRVLYYERTTSNKVNTQEIINIAVNNKFLEVNTTYSSPTIAVVSNNVFNLFTENFDFNTMGDFISGILATGIYNFKINIISDAELHSKTSEYHMTTEYSTQYYTVNSGYSSAIYTETLYCSEEPETFYNIEVNTLFDYYKMNSDVAEKAFTFFKQQRQPEFIKGHVTKTNEIFNSFVGEKSSISGNLKNCIVWENCHITEDYEGYIFCQDGKMYNFYDLEYDQMSCIDQDLNSSKLDTNKEDTFFSDFNSYLSSCIYSPRIHMIDLNDVFKQISLLRIVWNASKLEVIEAFSYFFLDSVDLNFIEDSISKCTIFFGILAEFVQTREDQETLLKMMYEYLIDLDFSNVLRAQIFFSFVYIFVESNIVEKSVAKKYNKMHKAGNF